MLYRGLFGKIGRYASADVIVHILQAKCFPALLYGLDACPVDSTEPKSLEFALFRVYAKIFETSTKNVIEDGCTAFGLDSIVTLINKSSASLNEVCDGFHSIRSDI